ncbi:phage tail protein, partial [Ralstonia pseudosolanacearum]|uniref:phage tail protein n=1 Tax=Ralstonia pseudosolanacearum TaxID=1310165 RepID=UPI003CFAD7FE
MEYIDSDGGIELYGVRCGTVTWDDITDPDNLYRAAMFYLTRQNLVLASHALEAVDLSYLDIDPDGIVLGDWYPVINTVLGINTTLEVTAMTVDLSKPWCPSITLGAKSVNLNDILAGGLSEKAREQVDSAISSGSAANNEILAMIQNEQRENSETLDEVANTQTLMSTAFLIDPEGNEADLLFDKILVSTTGDGTERERATA